MSIIGVHIASYGGGVNSKWMIAKRVRDKKPLHLVIYADPGKWDAEKPETYRDILAFGEWLSQRGVPLQVVRVSGETLYDNCIRRKALPAIAYGFKTCSQRWKIEPQEKFLNSWIVSREAWARGELITRLIGIDAGEAHRAKEYRDNKYVNVYPLVEDGDDRDACVAGLQEMGLTVPIKSACYFCPQSKPRDVVALNEIQLASALFMEENAAPNLKSLKGLGRYFSFKGAIEGQKIKEMQMELPCGCFDGEDSQ